MSHRPLAFIARPLQSEVITVRISRLRTECDDEPETMCHGQRPPSCRVRGVAAPEVLIEPLTAPAPEEPIMSTASTASMGSMGLLTSSRRWRRRADDIGSLCRNASPSRNGAFSCSVLNPSIAQHARFMVSFMTTEMRRRGQLHTFPYTRRQSRTASRSVRAQRGRPSFAQPRRDDAKRARVDRIGIFVAGRSRNQIGRRVGRKTFWGVFGKCFGRNLSV